MSGLGDNPWQAVAGAGRQAIMTTSVPTRCQAVISHKSCHCGSDGRDLGSATVQGCQAPFDPHRGTGICTCLQVRTQTQVTGQESEERPSLSQSRFRLGAQRAGVVLSLPLTPSPRTTAHAGSWGRQGALP